MTADAEYAIRITAENIKGESVPSGLIYQYAGAVPATLSAPTLITSSRTDYSVDIQWTVPGTSTTTVIGYRLYVNEPNSNAVPTILVYDGAAIPSVLKSTIYNLKSGSNYLTAYQVLNRAGWSTLSPTLHFVAGKLPLPPRRAPTFISSTTSQIKFSWLPTADIGGATKLESYKVYESGSLVATVSASTLEYTYTTVTAG